MSEKELTRAERIRENAFLDIICPSGNEYRVRKGSPRDSMIAMGRLAIDEALLAEWAEQSTGALNAPPVVENEKNKTDVLMLQAFCRDWIVDPKVILAGEPKAGEVTFSEMGADIYHLMKMWGTYCMGNITADDLQFFRSGLYGGEFRPTGPEVRSDATPAGEPEGKGPDS